MSIEAMTFSEQQTFKPSIIDSHTAESPSQKNLIQRRIDLQRRLGEVSSVLCEAQREYNALISDNIQLNSELHESGVDTEALARQIQATIEQPRPPARHLRIV